MSLDEGRRLAEQRGIERYEREQAEIWSLMYQDNEEPNKVLLADGRLLTPHYSSTHPVMPKIVRAWIKYKGFSVSGLVYLGTTPPIFEPNAYGRNARLCPRWADIPVDKTELGRKIFLELQESMNETGSVRDLSQREHDALAEYVIQSTSPSTPPDTSPSTPPPT